MKRHLLNAAIFLLAGAVVDVAVAWGCILAFPHPTKYRPVYLPSDAETRAWWHDNKPAGVTEGLAGVEIRERLGWRRLQYMGDHGGGSEILPSGAIRMSGRAPDSASCGQTFAGFPMMSLHGERWRRYCFERRAGELLAASGLTSAIGRMNYPFRPIWPGFAVNTVFYAAILWLMICGPLSLRRLIRVKRGRCPVCAYPKGHSAICTECGKAIPHSAVA